MQQPITDIVEHLSASHREMARVLEAKRHVAVRLAEGVHALPDENPAFEGMPVLIENAKLVTKSIVGYLNSLADLEETIADHLSHVFKEIDGQEE
ncbi:nucleoside-diphosphate sugar epimerase [Paenibacillus sp. IB182496]|uniref:Nucleoside-diphosphate sugar epimerase n=1 Tax=Paenibacillus sabuli TaxID=2772509 RepID=A0A927BYQ2_9BACL|nr:nucleoside-diphosphate sugar epimerase [Paenibacillus sabuli]MBD2848195.1 nucleoside-diphosphate sugar epimerase [Paenibacillus sabuli]